MTTRITLKDVRLSYPNLFHAKEFKAGDGKPRWSATFIVAPGSENDKAIRAAIEAESKLWGAKAAVMLKGITGQANKHCYLDGDMKGGDEFAGQWVLATHRSAKLARPLILDRNLAPLTADDGKPYGGCYVNAKVEIYAQAGENAGMRASFEAIQFVRDGEPFGSAAPTADGFDVLEGADADDLS